MKAIEAARSGEAPSSFGPAFVDDFAWPSLYDEDAPVNVKRWEASPVRRTMTTWRISRRPSGCATLDGLDAVGNPYLLNPTNAQGLRGHLTSRRLLLGGQCAGRQRGAVVLVPKRRHRQRCRCRRGQLDCGVSGQCGRGRSMAMGVVDGRHRRRHGVSCCRHSHRRRGVLPQRISVPHSELRGAGRQCGHVAPRLRARGRGRHGARAAV